MKKNILSVLGLLLFSMTVNAQLIKPKQQDTYTLDANGQIVRKDEGRKGLFDRAKTTIDAKYLAGACPEVNGKVQFDQTIVAPGLKAQEVYDRLLQFMMAFCKGPQQTELSNVSLVDETNHVIGVRIQEWLVFENKALSLDQTKFNYQLVITCKDEEAVVTMRNLSYIYDEERGGGFIAGEDMLTDANAINKKGDGFNRGGHKKFRCKTIDRKDEIMSQLEGALK